MKYCISCGKQIEDNATFCPNCGTRQEANQTYNKNPQSYGNNWESGCSTNKILSIVALGISIIGIFFGGILAEVIALVLSVIVLKSDEPTENEAITFAKIALILSIVLIGIFILYLILIGGTMVTLFTNLL